MCILIFVYWYVYSIDMCYIVLYRYVYSHSQYYYIDMGWLRLVGSWKVQVSFAEYSLLYRALLQKRPMILRSLLIVASPYVYSHFLFPLLFCNSVHDSCGQTRDSNVSAVAECVAGCWSVLQCVAVCCRVRCSDLQCVAGFAYLLHNNYEIHMNIRKD